MVETKLCKLRGKSDEDYKKKKKRLLLVPHPPEEARKIKCLHDSYFEYSTE